jgi:hypothetical protein
MEFPIGKFSGGANTMVKTIVQDGVGNLESPYLEKHARVSFSKTIKIEVFEKLTSVCFFQIARETILSHINNIHEKIMQSRA